MIESAAVKTEVDVGEKLRLSLSPAAHARYTQRLPGHGVQSAYSKVQIERDGS